MPVFDKLVEFGPSVIVLVSVIASLASTFVGALASLYALRAKRRARIHMRYVAKHDRRLKMLAGIAVEGNLSHEEFERLRDLIEKHLNTLPDRDRRVVEEGLYQSNTRGAERFLSDVVSQAA